MNRDQALRAQEVGAKHMSAGNYEKAVRFLEKSVSMFPTPQAEGLLARARKGPPPGSSSSSSAPSSGSASSTASTNQNAADEANLRRRRAAAAKARSEPAVDQRPFTQEQAADVRRIKRCTNLYDMLGVPKDAQPPTIKKGYRKMALKFHPDKNSAPGADDAFKEINRAFSVLKDDRKRMEYDQYGEASDNPTQGFARRTRDDAFDPADIFREVFGAQFAPNARTFHFGAGVRGPNARAQPANQSTSLLQLLPLLLLFLMSFASLPSQPEAVFSLHHSRSFPTQRKTLSPGVIPDIPFFVDNQFRRSYVRDPRKLQQVEVQVQSAYVKHVEKECTKGKKEQRIKVKVAKARGNDDLYRKEFEKLGNVPACKEWERVHSYIRS